MIIKIYTFILWKTPTQQQIYQFFIYRSPFQESLKNQV